MLWIPEFIKIFRSRFIINFKNNLNQFELHAMKEQGSSIKTLKTTIHPATITSYMYNGYHTFPLVKLLTSSQIFSSLGIQLVAKWQFCNTTHVPSTMAFSIIFAAIGP